MKSINTLLLTMFLVSCYAPTNPKYPVDAFLKAIDNNQVDGISDIVDTTMLSMLIDHSYYRMSDWSIDGIDIISDQLAHVFVDWSGDGYLLPASGRTIFYVKRIDESWIIYDSDNYFFIETSFDIPDEYTDYEEYSLIHNLPSLVKIDKWTFTYYNDHTEGRGSVNNNSSIALDDLKAKITYFDRSDRMVNTDEIYVISSRLDPGEVRSFDWYTSACYSCYRAKVELVFTD